MRISNQINGTVGSDPRSGTLPDGRPFAGFRMAVNHEFFNPATGAYEETDTSWFDVSVYGAMAQNVASSVHKGDPVLVTGRLRVRDWESQGKTGTSAEIIADAVGHNLRFGTASFQRFGRKRAGEPTPQRGGPDGGGQVWGGLDGSGADPFSTGEQRSGAADISDVPPFPTGENGGPLAAASEESGAYDPAASEGGASDLQGVHAEASYSMTGESDAEPVEAPF